MTAVVVIVLAAVLSVPVVAAVLVSVASRREDREWTLAGPAPGPARMAARRIVAFHSEGMDWLSAAGARRNRPAGPGHQPGTSRRPRPETATRPGRDEVTRAAARPRIPAAARRASRHSPAARALPAAAGVAAVCARSSFPK